MSRVTQRSWAGQAGQTASRFYNSMSDLRVGVACVGRAPGTWELEEACPPTLLSWGMPLGQSWPFGNLAIQAPGAYLALNLRFAPSAGAGFACSPSGDEGGLTARLPHVSTRAMFPGARDLIWSPWTANQVSAWMSG